TVPAGMRTRAAAGFMHRVKRRDCAVVAGAGPRTALARPVRIDLASLGRNARDRHATVRRAGARAKVGAFAPRYGELADVRIVRRTAAVDGRDAVGGERRQGRRSAGQEHAVVHRRWVFPEDLDGDGGRAPADVGDLTFEPVAVSRRHWRRHQHAGMSARGHGCEQYEGAGHDADSVRHDEFSPQLSSALGHRPSAGSWRYFLIIWTSSVMHVQSHGSPKCLATSICTSNGTPMYEPGLAASFASRSAHQWPTAVSVPPCIPAIEPPNDSGLAGPTVMTRLCVHSCPKGYPRVCALMSSIRPLRPYGTVT